MLAQAQVIRITERRVVDRRPLRSRPQSMRVSLPFVRSIDEQAAPLVPDMPDEFDALPLRRRAAG